MKRAKRFLALLLSIVMILGMLPISALAAGSAFSDVKTFDWFYNDVQYVCEKGLMNGTGSNSFSPKGTTTRGMIVTILYRMAGAPAVSGVCPFKDIAAGAYYEKPVIWAAENNIVSGYSADTFGPDGAITREQLAAILYRYAKFCGYDETASAEINLFTDAGAVSSYALTAMKWASAEGLINGSGSKLDPQGSATRAQVAAILTRFCKQFVDKTSDAKKPAASTGTDWNPTPDPDPNPNPPTPPTPGSTYTVTFDSNGGSAVASQTVAAGQTATEPEEPEKVNCVFIGWYCGTGYSAPFGFETPIDTDIIVYAKWFNTADTTDTDGDGLTDELEEEFGSDPENADTDGDGVPDFIELDWLNTDPTSPDTDGNGISDADEDADGDGLTNGEEVKLGTNPIYADTDGDYLSDYDEVYVYHTDPLNADTDGDGVNDGVEIRLGTNPLVAETSFETVDEGFPVDERTPVGASAKVITDAEGAGTLLIEEVTPLEQPLLSQGIAGYLGSAYNFTTKGTFESAEITFHYDTSLGEIGDDFQPRIYYFNEETGLLEELPNQTVADGVVSVTVEHFSTYILLNKIAFDEVWNVDIKTPQDQGDNQYTGIDIVFVIDSSGSMSWNDNNGLRKEAAKAFVEKLGEHDRAAVVDFDNYARVYQDFTGDHDSLNKAIMRVDSSGGTNLSAGMRTAIGLFTSSNYTRTDAYKYIIFLTDGDGSYDTSYTTQAHDNNIVVYTIGLGSGVKESKLREIATGTGGKYYFASTADALSDIYVDVSFETVDYTTDSNNDGISDYYTKLLNDGILPLSTGNFDLVDVLDMYGEDCDDWDGDGLKNGEEIQVCVTGSKVYVKMYSHPLLEDSDFDGFNDAAEKKFGTPPMKFTSLGGSSLRMLEDDNDYVYIDTANDRSALSNINAFFDWAKTDEATDQLIEYFYDYASADTIKKNQDEIAKNKARETYLTYAQAFANIAKAAKDVCSTIDDFKDMTTSLPDSGKAKEFLDNAAAKNSELKDTIQQLNTSRKNLLNAMNTSQFEDKDILKTALSNVDTTLSIVEEFSDLFKGYELEDATESISIAIASAATGVSAVVGTVKSVRDGMKYMKMSTKFKTVSDGYKDFLSQKMTMSTSDWVGVTLDVVDGALDFLGTCNTYGKMKANRDAYIAYIDLLYYMSEHAADKYVKTAAGDVAKIVQDETWKAYDKELWKRGGKTFASTSLSAAFTILAATNPYVAVAKLVYDVVKITISVTGLSNNAKTMVSCRTMQAVSDGCKYVVGTMVERKDAFVSYDSYAYSYLVQLAQSRLVGEDFAKQRMKKLDLAAVIARWFAGMSKEEINELFKTKSGSIYSSAAALKLELSSNLPYYGTFNSTGGGGSR